MDEPAAGLKPGLGYLHGVMVYPLAVNIPCPGNGVDFSVESAGRYERLYGKTAGRYGIPPGDRGCGRHGAKAIIGDSLAAVVTQFDVVVADDDTVKGIVQPVILEGIRLIGICFKLVGLLFPLYHKVYHVVKGNRDGLAVL